MTYNSATLMDELLKAGLPVEGTDSNGKIDFKPEVTDGQREQAAQILAAHNPAAPSSEEQVQLQAMSALKALNGRDIKTLNITEVITVLRFLLAQSGLVGSNDTIQA